MRPPTIAPAVAFSPARLLVAAILLAVVVLLALVVAWRRARVADALANEPLKRLTGFHIFGPDDDDDELLVHVPVLRARPANGGSPPAPPRPGRLPLPATQRAAVESAPTRQPAPAPSPAATSATSSARSVPARAASRAPITAPPPPSARGAQVAAAPRTAPARPRRTATEAEPPLTWTTPRAASSNGAARPASPRPTAPRGEQRLHRELTGTPAPVPTPRQRLGQELPRDGDILLVEDDSTIAEMYQVLLSTRGYAARHALDGVEGIAMVRKRLPALILLDMMMPRMDGLQFLEALRGWPKTRDIPVVVLSNVGDRHLVDKAMSLGAVEYLVKAQTRPQVLIGALPHWLRGNRALTTLS